MKKTVTISGGFHNASNINVRVDVDGLKNAISDREQMWMVLERLTPRQLARVNNHMCGIDTCTCGPEHGWEVEIMEVGR